jgi:hypothetical protein
MLAAAVLRANAADAPKLAVEFNDLQPGDSGCRAVFVVNNGLRKPLEKMTLRIIGFDGKGHATTFLSLDVGPLPVGKTRVLRFDLGANVACNDVSRILLDDVTACTGADLQPGDCLKAMVRSGRAGIPFDL